MHGYQPCFTFETLDALAVGLLVGQFAVHNGCLALHY